MTVQIPLSKVPVADLILKKAKPQAAVHPWNISSARNRSPSEATDVDEIAPAARNERHETSGMKYSAQKHDSSTSLYQDYHGSHREYNHTSREKDSRERKCYGTTSPADHSRRAGELSYPDQSMCNGIDYYFQTGRCLKREVDNILDDDVAKAVRYMQSVVYFMCHGHLLERGSAQNKAFKLYSDTLGLIRYSMRVGSKCKPLLAVCFRCQAVLYWHMYLMKQSQIQSLHKEFNEHFSCSSLSPLPSETSIGSTICTSACSGAGPTSFPSSGTAEDQSLAIPKHIWSKVTDHFTLTSYAHKSLEAWKKSEVFVEQFRDLFFIVDRNCGKVAQFSSIPHVADWVEHILHYISSRWS